tara:strand:- start:346 stop:918 length:573 start_codon:yes stop_codon:yes gene_type:complete
MKKLLLFITVLFFGIYSVQAQDETSYGFAQGDWILGGQATYTMNSNDGVDTNTSVIAPAAHYMLSDSWSIGASLGYNGEMTNSTGEDVTSTNTQFGFNARNYVLDLGEKTQIFYEAGLSYKTGDNPNTLTLGLSAGMAYHVTENIALTLGLYNLMSYSDVDGGASNFMVGWQGSVNNPYAAGGFGVLFKL